MLLDLDALFRYVLGGASDDYRRSGKTTGSFCRRACSGCMTIERGLFKDLSAGKDLSKKRADSKGNGRVYPALLASGTQCGLAGTSAVGCASCAPVLSDMRATRSPNMPPPKEPGWPNAAPTWRDCRLSHVRGQPKTCPGFHPLRDQLQSVADRIRRIESAPQEHSAAHADVGPGRV